MKDVKRTVLWVLVGFCVISAFFGIFNLFASLQMLTTKISQLGIWGNGKTCLMGSTIAALVCAILCLVAVVLATVFFIKSKHSKMNVLILILIIATAVISVFFTVYPFLIPTILKAIDDKHNPLYYEGTLSYSIFVHYQTYLSAALSTFLPMLVSSGLVLGNVICRAKFQKQDEVEEPKEN